MFRSDWNLLCSQHCPFIGVKANQFFFLVAVFLNKIIISITQYHHPFSANINIQFNIHSNENGSYWKYKKHPASLSFFSSSSSSSPSSFCNNIKILLTTWDKTWSQDIYTTLIFILVFFFISYTLPHYIYTHYIADILLITLSFNVEQWMFFCPCNYYIAPHLLCTWRICWVYLFNLKRFRRPMWFRLQL